MWCSPALDHLHKLLHLLRDAQVKTPEASLFYSMFKSSPNVADILMHSLSWIHFLLLELELLSAHHLQLSASAGFAKAAQSHIAQGCAPHPMTDQCMSVKA
jgi:hypothetical protein